MASNQITRRNFVARAGLLMTALGLSGSVQSGLMDNILKRATRKWGREALAQSAAGAKFLVEICFRAGFQHNALFPSAGHADATITRDPRLNVYSSPGAIQALNRDGKNVYFARYTANQGADRLRQQVAAIPNLGVATSETVSLQTGQHTANFASRAPTGAAACPAVVHAAVAPARPVQGIFWRNGAAVNNATGGLQGPSQVQTRAQFQSLFRELPMYFSRQELRLIVGAFDDAGNLKPNEQGALQRLDSMWRAAQDPRSGVYNDTDAVVVSSLGGRNQSTLSLVEALDNTYNQVAPNFGATIDNPLGGTPVGQALASAVSAFRNGAASTFTVALDSNDWHGDIPALDNVNSKQGQWNIVLGNALAGLWQSAQALPDPEGQGVVADHLLVTITSEFTRTQLRNGGGTGSDNGDGGRAAFAYMGKMVKNGSFGDVNGTNGAVVGFDRVTGANGGATPTEAQLYRTTLKMIGADSMASQFGVSAMPLDCLIR